MKIYKISVDSNYADEFDTSAYMYCREDGLTSWQNHEAIALAKRYKEDGEIRVSIGSNEVLYLEPDDFVIEETDMTEEELAVLEKYECDYRDDFGIFETVYDICSDYGLDEDDEYTFDDFADDVDDVAPTDENA